MESIPELFVIRIVLSLGMLAIGGILDVWKREVHDYLWIVFGSVGALLIVLEPNPMEFGFVTLFALLIAPLAIIVWRLGLFGGADAFALIALAVITPQFTISENHVTPFTTLSNAAVLFVIPLLSNILRNIIAIIRNENIFEGFKDPYWKKIFAMCIGYKAKNPKYGFSIEKRQGSIKKITLSLHNAEDAEFEHKKNTWITPGIPYLLLIIGGFIIQLIYGDIIINSMSFNL